VYWRTIRTGKNKGRIHVTKKLFLIMPLLFLTGLRESVAQNVCQNSSKLGCLISNVYGPTGLTLPNPSHVAHFNSGFQNEFVPLLTSALGSQLALLPVASPASGFIFAKDPVTGVWTRSAQSFGPILTERAETIGKGRLSLGFSYQRFNFRSLDDASLQDIPAVFHHDATTSPYGQDFITTVNSLTIKMDQFTFLGTVGITSWLDASLAIPVISGDVRVVSDATINRVAAFDPVTGPVHYFDPRDPVGSTRKAYYNSGTASGIGDITLRLKGNALKGERLGLSILTDVRFPSGDELNFLGAGTYGIKPFAALSYRLDQFSPHFNIGYEWNGDSLLMGDLMAGTKGKFPNQFFYAVGTDIGVTQWATMAMDFMQQRIIDRPELVLRTYTSPLSTTYPDITLGRGSSNVYQGAVGVKVNVASRLLVTANGLFTFNQAGLRDRFSPLLGIFYIVH
jgi:hypothetical protein